MKIIVLVKQVPDTYGERKLDPVSGLLERGAAGPVVDEINERAVEVALAYRDANKGAEVVVISMGPSSSLDALRKVLAMGADSAVHVLDESLVGSDATWTASVLAVAAQKTGFDLIIAGNESTDGRGGVIAAMLAEHLGVPHLTGLDTIEIAGSSVAGERAGETGVTTAHAALPAVISVTERSAEPRFPNFKGIMTAKKKPLSVFSISDLGLDSSAPRATTRIVSVVERPARSAGRKVVDNGSAADELAEFLAAGHLI